MDSGKWVDLAIGLAQSAVGVFLSWKAYVVSLKDFPKKQQRKDSLVFSLCCIAVIALAGVQTYRNFGLTDQLNAIATNTRRQASINIFPRAEDRAIPIPLKPGDSLWVNYTYEDVGEESPKDLRIFARTSLEYGPLEDRAIYERAWTNFLEVSRNDAPNYGIIRELPMRTPFFGTTKGTHILNEKELVDVQEGRAHIFLEVSIHYTDDTGKWIQEGCFLVEPPAFPTSSWHLCGTHGLRLPEN